MTRPRPFSVAFVFAGVLALGTAGAAMLERTRVDSREAAALPIPDSTATLRRAPACPLTRGQEKKAIEKFKKLLPVVQHPRCLNCHGGVNPFVDKRQGGHLGGAIDQSGGFIKQQQTCQECHSGLPGWELPPEDFFFVGKRSEE